MLTENQIIMHEIHNEQRELKSSIDGQSLLLQLRSLTFLDIETRSLLWRSSSLKRTFFGYGLFDDLQDDLTTGDKEVDELLNYTIKAFLMAGITYKNNPEREPLIILAEHIKDIFTENIETTEIEFDDECVIDFLAGLIECETLAAWLLVSEIKKLSSV